MDDILFNHLRPSKKVLEIKHDGIFIKSENYIFKLRSDGYRERKIYTCDEYS